MCSVWHLNGGIAAKVTPDGSTAEYLRLPIRGVSLKRAVEATRHP